MLTEWVCQLLNVLLPISQSFSQSYTFTTDSTSTQICCFITVVRCRTMLCCRSPAITFLSEVVAAGPFKHWELEDSEPRLKLDLEVYSQNLSASESYSIHFSNILNLSDVCVQLSRVCSVSVTEQKQHLCSLIKWINIDVLIHLVSINFIPIVFQVKVFYLGICLYSICIWWSLFYVGLIWN